MLWVGKLHFSWVKNQATKQAINSSWNVCWLDANEYTELLYTMIVQCAMQTSALSLFRRHWRHSQVQMGKIKESFYFIFQEKNYFWRIFIKFHILNKKYRLIDANAFEIQHDTIPAFEIFNQEKNSYNWTDETFEWNNNDACEWLRFSIFDSSKMLKASHTHSGTQIHLSSSIKQHSTYTWKKQSN